MFTTLRSDIHAVLARDPAARSRLEILLCYPGLHAIWGHRLGHWLWTHGFKVLARWTSHVVRGLTGIEIHPGARIGPGFFIIAANAVVVNSVPPNSVVVGVPGQIVKRSKPHTAKDAPDLAHAVMPDTIGASLGAVISRVEALERDARKEAVRAYVSQIPDRGIWRGEDFAI